VNVELGEDGVSRGNNWLSVDREPKEYFTNRLTTYEELFREWQSRLRFIVGGRDAD